MHQASFTKETLACLKYVQPSASDFEMYTLLETVLMRNAFLVRKLIKSNNVDINNYKFCDHYDGTLLHVAAKVGALDIVKILVEEGHADINMTDDCDEVPMHCAARCDHIDIVRYLAEKGSTDIEDVEHLLKPAEKTFSVGQFPIGTFVDWCLAGQSS